MPEPQMAKLRIDAAREWFISRIVERAAAEGKPLNQVERRYLDYELIDNDQEAEMVEAQFSAEHKPGEFLDRCSRLLREVFEGEIKADPGLEGVYREAYKAVVSSGFSGPLSRFVEKAFGSDMRFRVL